MYLNRKEPHPSLQLCSEIKPKEQTIDEDAEALAAGKKAVEEEESYKKWINEQYLDSCFIVFDMCHISLFKKIQAIFSRYMVQISVVKQAFQRKTNIIF
jgi:hypothetical protein